VPLGGSNTSARLFIKEPINGLQVFIAWQYRLHPQAVPQRNPETHQAVSGNFPEIRILTDNRGSWKSNTCIYHTIHALA